MNLRIACIAAAALAATSAAHAQPTQPRAPLGVEQGFFRPAPDPSLTAVRPATPPPAMAAVPRSPAAQAPANAAGAPPVAPAMPANAAGAPPMHAAGPFPPQPAPVDPAEAIRLAEEQLDRSEREAERARMAATQGPPPIAGAFTGLTSERDR